MKRIVFWFYEEKLLQYHIKQIFLGISGKVLQYYWYVSNNVLPVLLAGQITLKYNTDGQYYFNSI